MNKEKPKPYEEQGARIRLLRTARDMTIEELANQMDVTYQSAQQWEAGFTSPRPKRLQQLAAILNTSVQEITVSLIGTLRCVFNGTDKELGKAFGKRVKVSGQYEVDHQGLPRLLYVDQVADVRDVPEQQGMDF